MEDKLAGRPIDPRASAKAAMAETWIRLIVAETGRSQPRLLRLFGHQDRASVLAGPPAMPISFPKRKSMGAGFGPFRHG